MNITEPGTRKEPEKEEPAPPPKKEVKVDKEPVEKAGNKRQRRKVAEEKVEEPKVSQKVIDSP